MVVGEGTEEVLPQLLCEMDIWLKEGVRGRSGLWFDLHEVSKSKYSVTSDLNVGCVDHRSLGLFSEPVYKEVLYPTQRDSVKE